MMTIFGRLSMIRPLVSLRFLCLLLVVFQLLVVTTSTASATTPVLLDEEREEASLTTTTKMKKDPINVQHRIQSRNDFSGRRYTRSVASEQQQIYRITISETLWRHRVVSGQEEEEANVDSTEDIVAIPIVQGQETAAFYTVLSFSLQDLVLPTTTNLNTTSETDTIDVDPYALLERGELFIATSGARVRSDRVLVFSERADMVVLPTSPIVVEDATARRRRELANGITPQQPDTRTIAALRVSMTQGPVELRQVSYSNQEIHQQLFESDVGFTNQLHACSGGALRVLPGGVFEVTVPGKFSDYDAPSAVRDLALILLANKYGVVSAKELADHILVFLPPNNFPGFIGNAALQHWVMTVNNLWGLDVNVYMHEMGHNLGLNHASMSDGDGDYSSYMSATGQVPQREGPRKCYNAAGNRQLGWWNAVDVPLEAGKTNIIRLAAFSEHNPLNLPTLLTAGRYSIQYNYASNFNSGTEILRNKVTVAHEESDKTVVQRQGLSPDGLALVLPTNGDADANGPFSSSKGSYIQIEACKSVGPIMEIGISLDRWGSPCVLDAGQIESSQTTEEPTPEPTKKPTRGPTRAPTPEPTHAPSLSPTKKPSQPPTNAPSPEPTLGPTKKPSFKPTEEPTPEPTKGPTPEQTKKPSVEPTKEPSFSPTKRPTLRPSPRPTPYPSGKPSADPTARPSFEPTFFPTTSPSSLPTVSPTETPTTTRPSISASPSSFASEIPSGLPTKTPSNHPTTPMPSGLPSYTTNEPTHTPSELPATPVPSSIPTPFPSFTTDEPTPFPSYSADSEPTPFPSALPTTPLPSSVPTRFPSFTTDEPTPFPSYSADDEPTPSRFRIPTFPSSINNSPTKEVSTGGRFSFGGN
eukprot:scaffold13094_cov162-Amphora_coffeaeformis.AAC.2